MTLLSRTAGVSRQTLYARAEQGRVALEQTFAAREVGPAITPALERQVLSPLVETHGSVRGIQVAVVICRPRDELGRSAEDHTSDRSFPRRGESA